MGLGIVGLWSVDHAHLEVVGAGARGSPVRVGGRVAEGRGFTWKCFLNFCSEDLDPSDLCLSPLWVRGLPA